jgi:hypothetical protein
VHLAADMTGNGNPDLVSYHERRGRWWVTESLGGGKFATPKLLTVYGTTSGWTAHLAADVTGNGHVDLISYHPSRGRWWVTESLGGGKFGPPKLVTTYPIKDGWQTHVAADMTGNGRTDLVSYHPGEGRWYVTEGQAGGTFKAPRVLTVYNTKTGWSAHLLGDVTGNGRVDLVSYHPQRGRWWVTESLGGGKFATPALLTTYGTTSGWAAHLLADIDGDGKPDLVSYHPSRGRWWLTRTLGGGKFADPVLLTTYKPADGWAAHLAADMTRNGAADLVSYLPAKGQWWITTDINRR